MCLPMFIFCFVDLIKWNSFFILLLWFTYALGFLFKAKLGRSSWPVPSNWPSLLLILLFSNMLKPNVPYPTPSFSLPSITVRVAARDHSAPPP